MKLRPGVAPAQLSLCAKQVWNAEVWDEAIAILRANRAALEALAGELDRLGEVRGRPLRQILAQVKRRDA
jgi:hypothetical protein